MKTLLTHLRALAVLVLASSAVMAGDESVEPGDQTPFIIAQSGDCYSVGLRYAQQVGGELARASAENRGGQTVCVVVVLMPAEGGQRPRREEVVLPLG